MPKHIVWSHKQTLKPKPAKELVCFSSSDFADTKKLNLKNRK